MLIFGDAALIAIIATGRGWLVDPLLGALST